MYFSIAKLHLGLTQTMATRGYTEPWNVLIRFFYLCNGIKDADQLLGYRAADLQLHMRTKLALRDVN